MMSSLPAGPALGEPLGQLVAVDEPAGAAGDESSSFTVVVGSMLGRCGSTPSCGSPCGGGVAYGARLRQRLRRRSSSCVAVRQWRVLSSPGADKGASSACARRSGECDVRMDQSHSLVSRKHVQFLSDGGLEGRALMKYLGAASNGVSVNGHGLARGGIAQLGTGDVVTVRTPISAQHWKRTAVVGHLVVAEPASEPEPQQEQGPSMECHVAFMSTFPHSRLRWTQPSMHPDCLCTGSVSEPALRRDGRRRSRRQGKCGAREGRGHGCKAERGARGRGAKTAGGAAATAAAAARSLVATPGSASYDIRCAAHR